MASPTSATHALLDEEFGQKVDLTVRIREVLTNYPSGPSSQQRSTQHISLHGIVRISSVY
jgi:hypothetical protein